MVCLLDIFALLYATECRIASGRVGESCLPGRRRSRVKLYQVNLTRCIHVAVRFLVGHGDSLLPGILIISTSRAGQV